MNTLNIFILIMLFLSPFFYLPIVVNKKRRAEKGFIWFQITFLIGLIQSLCYLIILILIGIPI